MSQGAFCGSFAGAIASAATCPSGRCEDTTDARREDEGDGRALRRRCQLVNDDLEGGGLSALFSGLGPRVGWITVGGFVFFGAYEKAQEVLWATGGWGKKPIKYDFKV